jgi:hypothetical protein
MVSVAIKAVGGNDQAAVLKRARKLSQGFIQGLVGLIELLQLRGDHESRTVTAAGSLQAGSYWDHESTR